MHVVACQCGVSAGEPGVCGHGFRNSGILGNSQKDGARYPSAAQHGHSRQRLSQADTLPWGAGRGGLDCPTDDCCQIIRITSACCSRLPRTQPEYTDDVSEWNQYDCRSHQPKPEKSLQKHPALKPGAREEFIQIITQRHAPGRQFQAALKTEVHLW